MTTQFGKISSTEVKCDICGEIMHPMPGDGWDYDRMACAVPDCGAEIVFPTSTDVTICTTS